MDQCCGINGSIKMEDLLRSDIPAEISLEIAVELFQSLIILETSYLHGASLLEVINSVDICMHKLRVTCVVLFIITAEYSPVQVFMGSLMAISRRESCAEPAGFIYC